MSLDEMKLEVIKDVLEQNDKMGYSSPKEEDEIRGLLQKQIKLFEERAAKVKAEQAGADQPATKPADKAPVKDQPPTPTSKDGPR